MAETGPQGGSEPVRRQASRRLLLCILLAAVAQGMVLPFLFVYLTHVRHVDPTWAGLVAGWVGLGGLLLAGPVGTLVDRFGSRRVMVAVMVLYAGGVASYAEVHRTWQAFLAATLAAFGGAPLLGAYNTLLASATEPEEQQRFFALAFAALNLGLGVGGLVGGAVADVHHPVTFVWLYLLDGLGLCLSALVVVTMRGAGGPHAAEATATAGSYRQVLADPPFRRFLGLAVLLMSVAYAQLEFGFPAFAVDVSHVSARVIGWAFAANSMTIVAAQLLVVRHLEGRARSRVLALVALVLALAWLVLGAGAAGRHVAAAFGVVGVVGCAVVFAVAEVLMSPVLPSITNALAPDALRGRYNALSSMVLGATSVIGPATAGPLIGHGAARLWLALVVAGALAAALLALRMGPDLDASPDRVAAAAAG